MNFFACVLFDFLVFFCFHFHSLRMAANMKKHQANINKVNKSRKGNTEQNTEVDMEESSSSEGDEQVNVVPQVKDKKEATEIFKELLREKVRIYL